MSSKRELLEIIIETYGKKSQVDVCIEECSELIKALLKERRYPCDAEFIRTNVIDEIADVQIMLWQLQLIYECQEEVKHRINYKIDRQIKRLERN